MHWQTMTSSPTNTANTALSSREDSRGSTYCTGPGMNTTIGDHLPHVVGMAWAAKLRNDDRVAVAHFGDGATSEGDFHEALNFAGVFDVPALFICNNNQWAISVPSERQTASATFAQKAHAYGFEGVQVDGMDPLAMYVTTRAAREKAKQPIDGRPRPTLIEAVQYRFGAHTTADDPSVYRDQADVERWRQRDPLTRFEAFLRDTGRIDDEGVDRIDSEIEDDLANLFEPVESHDADPDEMFDYTYAEPTDRLLEQREYLRSLRKSYGDEALLQDE
jgi:pyruvate dehydrogenase E1 component alpha subunit